MDIDGAGNKIEWRPIPVAGYEKHYEISSAGRVRRAKPGPGTHVGLVLKPKRDKDGYLYQNIWAENKTKTVKNHQLVLRAFVGPTPKGQMPNHKNGIKSDNRLANLEYMTPAQNNLHSYRVLGRRGHQVRRTVCFKGHPMTPENVLTTKTERRCRICRLASSHAR
jgi:hypothetical protein